MLTFSTFFARQCTARNLVTFYDKFPQVLVGSVLQPPKISVTSPTTLGGNTCAVIIYVDEEKKRLCKKYNMKREKRLYTSKTKASRTNREKAAFPGKKKGNSHLCTR